MTSSKNYPSPAPLFGDAFLHKLRGGLTVAAVLTGALSWAGTGRAASATFSATPTDANWATGTNWSTGAAPGSTTAVNNDTATFNTALAANPTLATATIGGSDNPILPDAGRRIGNILFDTANVGAYYIGVNGGTTLNLSAQQSGVNAITINPTVVNSEVIAAPLSFVQPSSQSDVYNFLNNSTTSGVTLSLTGGISYTNTTRGYTIGLGGTSVSNNIITGNISETVTSAGFFPWLTKNGAGTWILTGTATLTGGPTGSTAANNPFTGAAYGVQINAGTLVAENSTAFGTSATANNYKVTINNTGTLQLANNPSTGAITLDNGVLIQFNSGGTLTANGSQAENSGITVGTAAATSVTIGTTNATDVFTLGNAANDLTGGAADSTIHIAGPGTVILSQTSNYAGGFSIDGGILQNNTATSLGAAGKAITFGSGSNGRLRLYGNNLTISGLTTNATNPGSATVTNGLASTAVTLTLNNASANTFAGSLQDGTAGTLAFTKTGAGTLTLTGASTYSGATALNGGSTFINNTTGSGLGAGAVSVGAGGTVGGTGSVSSAVTVAGRISPGATGTGAVGTITFGSLTLSAGSNLDLDITSTSTLDQITVANSGGLTINGGQVNINGAAATFTTAGVYNLIGYSGTVNGTGVSALTLNSTNQDNTNDTYTFGLSGSYVTLTVAASGATVDYYTPDANNLYSNPANWSTGNPPNAVGAFAGFGGNGSATLTANRTITVDNAYTVGTISLNSTSGFGYTLANGGPGTGLTLNNGTSTSFISDTAGTHTIAAPLTLTPNGATVSVIAAADVLTISGVIASDATTDAGITKGGNGTVALTGVNTYYGGTTLNGGIVQINSASSLGDPSGNLTFNGGSLQLLADVTTPRNYALSGANSATIDTNGHALVLNGTLTPIATATGGVVKNGLGTLTFGGTNTYTGATTINAGMVSVAADSGLGTAPTSAGTNVTIANGATLQATASFTLNANRSITLGGATSAIDIENGATVAYGGVISGSGALNLTGNGALAFSTAQSYTGNTIISGATLQYGAGTGIPGSITLTNGGTFSLTAPGTAFPGNNITVAASSTGTYTSSSLTNASGSIFSSGDANSILNIGGNVSLGTSTTVLQFGTGYTGTVHLNTGATLRWSGTLNSSGTNGDGGLTTTFDMAAGSAMYSKGGGLVQLGALTGTGGIFGASTAGQTTTYAVGAKNLSTTFGGTFNNNDAVTVTGTGTLTLTGANTETGLVTVNNGATLQIDNGGTTGVIGTGAVTDNGIVAYNRSDSYTIGNPFTGSGTLTFLGAGTKTFTGSTALTNFNSSNGTLIIDPTIGSGLAINTLNSTLAPNAGDNATVTVQNSGSYNVNSTNFVVGGLGTATLNINGPTAAGNNASGGMVALTSGLTIGKTATAVGLVVLNSGGTLNTPLINTLGGSSTFDFNGGTVAVAAGATGAFMSGLTAANVQAGGAFFNTAGTAATIAQVLAHDPSLGATADGGLTVSDTVGTGTLTLTAANTYTGPTTINAGATLRLGDGTSGDDGTLASTSGLTDNGSLIYNRFTARTTPLSIGGTGSVTVSGPGLQTFTGANTYTGTTTINSAAFINGSLGSSGTPSGAVIVPSGGTLGGSGMLTVASASVAGTLAPGGTSGATTGTLTLNTTNGLTLSGTLVIALNSTSGVSSGTVLNTGAFTLSGATLSLTGTADGTTTYNLVDYTGALGGDGAFANLTVPAGYTINYAGTTFSTSDIELDPNGTAVPEPSTWALCSFLLGVATLSRRRLKGLIMAA